jgi:hypothetical protein
MATCLEIITYALRMSKVVGMGKDPKSAESDEGMVALQALYDQWRTGGMFGTLEDVTLEEDDTAEEGKRYFVPTGFTLTDATSVYVDASGETRQPRDLALYESLTEAGDQAAKIYDRTEWRSLLGLESADIAPLSGRNAYGLAACLATSGGFVAGFGAEPSPATIAVARHFLRNIMDKGGSTQDRDGAVYY